MRMVRRSPVKHGRKGFKKKSGVRVGKTIVNPDNEKGPDIKSEYKEEQQILKSVFAGSANSAFPQHTAFVRGINLTLSLLSDENFVESIKKQNLDEAGDIIADKIVGDMFCFIGGDLIESKNVLIDDLKKYYEEFKEETKYDA